jgi:biotin synthase
LEIASCPGNVVFAPLARIIPSSSRTGAARRISKLTDFCKDDDLYGLYLMCMHEYNLEFFLEEIRLAKKLISGSTQLLSNVGDTDLDASRN